MRGHKTSICYFIISLNMCLRGVTTKINTGHCKVSRECVHWMNENVRFSFLTNICWMLSICLPYVKNDFCYDLAKHYSYWIFVLLVSIFEIWQAVQLYFAVWTPKYVIWKMLKLELTRSWLWHYVAKGTFPRVIWCAVHEKQNTSKWAESVLVWGRGSRIHGKKIR